MKGYRTIEDFTFEDCQNYINSDINDEFSLQVQERYDQLLVKLQQEDDDKFYACKTKKDYQAYVDSYSSSVIGKSGCGGAHISEAQDIIKKWPYRIIKFIYGIILSAYLIPMTISLLYWATDITNNFKVCENAYGNKFDYTIVYYSRRWGQGWDDLVAFIPQGGVTSIPYDIIKYISPSKTLTEDEVLTIAKEIRPKKIIYYLGWVILHILCLVFVYRKLIKNNLKYIITK